MMTQLHPSYPHPTIQEALCEIHFGLPEGVRWDAAAFSDLFRRIECEFPVLEPAYQLGFRLQVGANVVDQAFVPPQQRMRYKHRSRNLLLQLSDGVFTVNELPTYPGWEQVSADIVGAWAEAREVTRATSISRIGLRYINSIEREHPEELPSEWLAASEYIPAAVLRSLPGFLLRLQTHTDPQSRRIVTVGESAGAPGGSQAIVFDIDCIAEGELDSGDRTVREMISHLHDAVWEIFSASITPRLEAQLRGGEQ
jgi:uncharacterized protein (TIGR04255 family)